MGASSVLGGGFFEFAFGDGVAVGEHCGHVFVDEEGVGDGGEGTAGGGVGDGIAQEGAFGVGEPFVFVAPDGEGAFFGGVGEAGFVDVGDAGFPDDGDTVPHFDAEDVEGSIFDGGGVSDDFDGLVGRGEEGEGFDVVVEVAHGFGGGVDDGFEDAGDHGPRSSTGFGGEFLGPIDLGMGLSRPIL